MENTQSNLVDFEFIADRILQEKSVLLIGPELILNSPTETLNQAIKNYLSASNRNFKFYTEDEFFHFDEPQDKDMAYFEIRKFYQQLTPPKSEKTRSTHRTKPIDLQHFRCN